MTLLFVFLPSLIAGSWKFLYGMSQMPRKFKVYAKEGFEAFLIHLPLVNIFTHAKKDWKLIKNGRTIQEKETEIANIRA